MPWSLQLPDGTIVLSNRFGCGPFDDCQPYFRVQLPQGVEIEGVAPAHAGGDGNPQAGLARLDDTE